MMMRFRRALGVLVVFGLIQAAVETAVIAVLYRDLLLAPYRFFSIQLYDASTKLYFWLAGYLPLPALLAEFVGQGLWAKATLFPELAAINVFIAAILALVLVPVAGGETSPIRRIVLVATIAAVVLHVVQWVAGTKFPLDPTPASVAANLARNALYDGAVFAVGVSLASALISVLVLGRGRAVAHAAAAAAVVAAAALPMLAGAQRGAQAIDGRGQSAPAHGYNVVLVSIDSLRADRMSLHGHDRETTPAMSQLARDGMYFENCRSTTSWTLPRTCRF